VALDRAEPHGWPPHRRTVSAGHRTTRFSNVVRERPRYVVVATGSIRRAPKETADIHGVAAVALLTIFDSSHELDVRQPLPSLPADCGPRRPGLSVAGSTGEAAALTPTERATLVLRSRRGGVASARSRCWRAQAPPLRLRPFISPRLSWTRVPTRSSFFRRRRPPTRADTTSSWLRCGWDACARLPLSVRLAPRPARGLLAELPVQGTQRFQRQVRRLYDELDVLDGWLYTGSANLVLFQEHCNAPARSWQSESRPDWRFVRSKATRLPAAASSRQETSSVTCRQGSTGSLGSFGTSAAARMGFDSSTLISL